MTHLQRFKNILCVVEPDEECTAGLERAVALAENNHAALTVVDVVESIAVDIELQDEGIFTEELQIAITNAHGQQLEALVNPFRSRIEIQTKVLTGTHFLEIIREVLRNGRDLVIKVPESPTWLEQVFGSKDMHLLRKCPCPVWLIKPTAKKATKVILAAVDVDNAHPADELATRYALNRQILEMAGSLALSDFSELHIVSTWRAIGETTMRGSFLRTDEVKVITHVENLQRRHQAHFDNLISEITDRLRQETKAFLKPRTYLIKGSARKEIPALAKRIGADLVVMGTVGRTGIPGFIVGNTAETILTQIDCSVLAIKPPGFITPVTVEA